MKPIENVEAALLTPSAPGAIAVIGVRGSAAPALLGRILRRARQNQQPTLPPDRPTLCRVVDEGRFTDDAVVTLFFTEGVTCAELCTHGGVRIVQRIMMLLQRHGARIVPAVQFAAGGAIDGPIEHEIDHALVGARQGVAAAVGRRLTQWLLAQRRILPPFLKKWEVLDQQEREAYCERTGVAARLLRGISIALAGPPNSGKSTLANRLIGTDRMITSDVPGTTRDWVSETALIEGWPVTLTDTAGHRASDCPIETEAIRRGGQQAGMADLVLLVLDGTLSDAALAEQAKQLRVTLAATASNAPVLNVLNKSDLIPGRTPPAGMAAVIVSARTGDGVEALERTISTALDLHLLDESQPTDVRERR